MKDLKQACWSIAALIALAAGPAWSQQLTGTLKKIKDTGTITLGHREIVGAIFVL